MTDKLRESVSAYWLEKHNEVLSPEDCLIEIITECNDGVVWEDSYLDHHRWYSLQNIVVKLGEYYIAYDRYIIQGDNCMGDMDLEYNIEDFTLVEKKTRIVEEVYYG